MTQFEKLKGEGGGPKQIYAWEKSASKPTKRRVQKEVEGLM